MSCNTKKMFKAKKAIQVKTKKSVATAKETPIRAALGDIQNREALCAQGAKDVAQDSLKDVKLQNAKELLKRQAAANVLPLAAATTTTTTNAKAINTQPAMATGSIKKPKQKLSNSEPSKGSKDSNQSRKSTAKTQTIMAAKRNCGTKIEIPTIGKALPLESLSLSRRLKGIEDIDANDKKNLILVAEYVNDIYDYLYTLEEAQFVRKDHLNGQLEVHPKMRSALIDWINEIHMPFNLVPETFYMTVSIIDLYLQIVKDTKRENLQLVGITAFYIAAKYEELSTPSISDFAYITDNTCSAQQIRLMELQILKTLDFTLSRPLPIHFLHRYSNVAAATEVHHIMSTYLLELSTIRYDLASYKPSELAAAAFFLSLHLLSTEAKEGKAIGFNNKHWTKTLEFYSRYTAEHLRPIAKKIANVARYAPQAKRKAVYNKYKLDKFQKISLYSVLYGPLMSSIVRSSD